MVAIKIIVNKLFYKSYDDPLKKKKKKQKVMMELLRKKKLWKH